MPFSIILFKRNHGASWLNGEICGQKCKKDAPKDESFSSQLWGAMSVRLCLLLEIEMFVVTDNSQRSLQSTIIQLRPMLSWQSVDPCILEESALMLSPPAGLAFLGSFNTGLCWGQISAYQYAHSGCLMGHKALVQKLCFRRFLDDFSSMRASVEICCFVSMSFHWDLGRPVSNWEIHLLG